MKTKINKLLYLLPFFLVLLACNESSSKYKPIAYGIKVDLDKNAYETTFEQYVKASIFGIVICPLSDDPPIQKILKNGFDANYKKAKIGDAKAQYAIGIAYIFGLGIERNDDLGIEWIRKAVAQDYPPALTSYGIFLNSNPKNPTNLSRKEIKSQSLKFLEKAANQNFLLAQFFLAFLKLTPNPEKDHEKWLKLLEKVAEQNNDEIVQSIAQSMLANFYLYGYYVPENHEMALGLFKKSIQHRPMLKSMGDAMIKIMSIYSNPINPNEKEAHLWEQRLKQFEKEAIHCQKYIPKESKVSNSF